jgi:hypothetical protein
MIYKTMTETKKLTIKEKREILQEISLKLYNDRIQDEDLIHRIAEDEFSGYFSKEQSLLLEKAVKNEIFKYFTDPISSLIEE